MKASDYIVEFLIKQGITDVFGYPGGMVTHLMDSLGKYDDSIHTHVTYHEQGAAFAACGYAQTSGKPGVAYATSGPGATNLITGICNAYFDSIPVLFITGQVNTFEGKGHLRVRQRGFQETDIVSMVAGVTKYAVRVERADQLRRHLECATALAMEGRKGPVLLDIPMNVFRAEIDPQALQTYVSQQECMEAPDFSILEKELIKAKRPLLLLGNGVKSANAVDMARCVASLLSIPVVTTMLAVDVIPQRDLCFGFIGAYGDRAANFIVAKSDLIISIGARLDVRQVGAKRVCFAPNAKMIRIDIDAGELEYRVHPDEIDIQASVWQGLAALEAIDKEKLSVDGKWLTVCKTIQNTLYLMDERMPNRLIKKLGELLPDNAVIVTDVGQNQVWVAQSLPIKESQTVLFSGGHGAMGYSLPASIGCATATKRPVVSFSGDGGFQMNIQELQTIVREKIPIAIILINNGALGMIRHFQEMYFQKNYTQTVPVGGYTVPNFAAIAEAYQLGYKYVENESQISSELFSWKEPCLIEIRIREETYVFPKLEFGKPNQDQEPLMDRELYTQLMEL